MVIKIIALILAVIIGLFVLGLMLRLKLIIGYSQENKFAFKIKLLCFTFGNKKKTKKKKESKFGNNIKNKLGIDILEKENFQKSLEEGSFTDKISRLIGILMLFLGQVKYLFSKMRVEKLDATIVCGGDGAEAAINYGLVCSAVYPFVGYLDANIKGKNNWQSINVCCDFENENHVDFNLIISVRIIYLLIVLGNMLSDAKQITEKMEETNNGN